MGSAIFAREEISLPRFLANLVAHEAPQPHRTDHRDVPSPPGRETQHAAPFDPSGRSDGLEVDRTPLRQVLYRYGTIKYELFDDFRLKR
jgi:hypothetical protein